MKRPTFRLRTLMIAVVVTALPVWGYRLKCRSREFTMISHEHALEADAIYGNILSLKGFDMLITNGLRRPLTDAEKINCANLELRWHFEMDMCHKYRHAAANPWLPVGPDPVPPPNPLRDGPWLKGPDPISDFLLANDEWHPE